MSVCTPLPVYTRLFFEGVGAWSFLLLGLPPVCFLIWFAGWLLDLVVRTGASVGGPGRRPTGPTIVSPGVIEGEIVDRGD
jgi:hypothetical protein